MQNWLTLNQMENLVYIYINNKLLWEQPSTILTAWYEKICCLKIQHPMLMKVEMKTSHQAKTP
jgi:hypothetical protein